MNNNKIKTRKNTVIEILFFGLIGGIASITTAGIGKYFLKLQAMQNINLIEKFLWGFVIVAIINIYLIIKEENK